MKHLRKFLPVLFAVLVGAASPLLSYGAAQLAAGASTSAKPTAPVGSQLRQTQLTFDPVTPNFAITDFQLTVGYDSNLVTPLFVDFTNTAFVQTGLVGPFVPAGTTPPGIDTYITISGTHDGSPLVSGDVDIFSVVFQLNTGVADDALLPFVLLAIDHTGDGTGLGADSLLSTDLLGSGNNAAGPADIELTHIISQTSGAFTTVTGNTALDPSDRQSDGVPNFYPPAQGPAGGGGGAAVPLPRGAWLGLSGVLALVVAHRAAGLKAWAF